MIKKKKKKLLLHTHPLLYAWGETFGHGFDFFFWHLGSQSHLQARKHDLTHSVKHTENSFVVSSVQMRSCSADSAPLVLGII